MTRLLLTIQILTTLLTGFVAGGGPSQYCYPNGTISVYNSNPSLFTNVVAVLYEGSSSAEDCSTSLSGSSVIIDGCSVWGNDITVHFSNRAAGSPDSVFGGSSIETYIINCNQIASLGVSRSVDEALTVSLEATSESSVTPSFWVDLDIRSTPTGAEVYNADVGDSLLLVLVIPGDYYARPDCYAYGNTNQAGPSVYLFEDGCRQDQDLLGTDFDQTTTSFLNKLYYATFYAFKFYASNDVIFECTVLICPNSAPCATSCSSPSKRDVSNTTDVEPGLQEFHTQTRLRINPPGSHASITLGSIWTTVGALVIALRQ